MTKVEMRLEEELRSLVIGQLVDAEAGAAKVRQLAEGLGVPTSSVEELLTKSHWDLGLTFRVMDHLGLSARAVLA